MANAQACELGCQIPVGAANIENNQNENTFDLPDQKFIATVMNLLAPNAAKDKKSVSSALQQIGSGLMLGVFGGAIIMGIIGVEKSIGDTLFSTPVKRAVWYGVIGAIVTASFFPHQISY